MTTDTVLLLSALSASRARLAGTLASLTDEQVAGPSYDDDWSIGQVASHLGSQSVIFGMFLEAGRKGTPPPGIDAFHPVWDEWNAKSPVAQARDAVSADAAFAARLDELGEDERSAWRLDLFGAEQDLAGLLRMRLGEHAVHTWDVAVAVDPDATLAEDAVPLLLDSLPTTAQRAGKPSPEVGRVVVTTTGPERTLLLDTTGDAVALTADAGATDSGADSAEAGTTTLTLPAEAFVRLVYGRLDPDHTPASVSAEGVDLDALRRVFPGF